MRPAQKAWGAYGVKSYASVIPTKVGIQLSAFAIADRWIPTFVAMTNQEDFHLRNLS